MKKLKPLVPSVAQMARLRRQPENSGFIVLHVGGGKVEVVEISVNPQTGQISDAETGECLNYMTTGGAKVQYRLEQVLVDSAPEK